jgi:hypothetical protein
MEDVSDIGFYEKIYMKLLFICFLGVQKCCVQKQSQECFSDARKNSQNYHVGVISREIDLGSMDMMIEALCDPEIDIVDILLEMEHVLI